MSPETHKTKMAGHGAWNGTEVTIILHPEGWDNVRGPPWKAEKLRVSPLTALKKDTAPS